MLGEFAPGELDVIARRSVREIGGFRGSRAWLHLRERRVLARSARGPRSGLAPPRSVTSRRTSGSAGDVLSGVRACQPAAHPS